MAQLVITNNNTAGNPLSLDLSPYMNVQDDAGMDPQNPQFTSKVFGRSLLKEGATLALEQLTEKELIFPLILGPVGGVGTAPTNMSALAILIQQIQEIVNTPGFTLSWQPLGASQPTVFDGLSGQFDVDYSYRAEGNFWTKGKLRVFTQPFGRVAGSRSFAAASAVGPLLMMSPYASSGSLIINASAAGYGASPQRGPTGASSGISYTGNPSLAGDATGLLQLVVTNPMPAAATSIGMMPLTAVSVLPDKNYVPLITAAEMAGAAVNGFDAGAVASTFVRYMPASTTTIFEYLMPLPLRNGFAVLPQSYAGLHRVFAIARASTLANSLQLVSSALCPNPTAATVYPGDWQLLDLGTLTFRASEIPPINAVNLLFTGPTPASTSVNADLTACIVLPENSTWFFNPQNLNPSSYGGAVVPAGASGVLLTAMPMSNTLILDDFVGDQFIYSASQPAAPAFTALNQTYGRITQYTRGLVPKPNPATGFPIVAVMSVGMPFVGSIPGISTTGASWANPQNQLLSAELNVVERTRYILS